MARNKRKDAQEAERAKAREVFLETGSVTEAARAIKGHRSTVYRHVKDLLPGVRAGREGPAADPIQAAEDRARRRRELEIERELLQSVGGERSFRAFLERVITKVVPPLPSARPPKAPARSRAAHERFPFLSLNDWHFEEIVPRESVLGLNEYSIPIACRRVWRVINACREWKRDIEAGGRFRVPELTVALNGDFLTGTLHGLERHSSAPNVIRAAMACGDLISMALRDLAAEFPRVRVIGTVGNHGRLPDQKKVPTKDPTRSFDYLAFGIAKRRLEGLPHVEFILPEAYGVLYEIAGHQCYQAHGNFIPQSLGIIGYGIRRFTAALAANLSAAGKPLKYAFFGHWHQMNAAEFAGVTTFVCPSLIGTQEYGFLASGSVNRAAQSLHIFDRQLGHVTTELLYGDGPGAGGTYQVVV
jgi:hypothetical protein